jgi:hypothetical protein
VRKIYHTATRQGRGNGFPKQSNFGATTNRDVVRRRSFAIRTPKLPAHPRLSANRSATFLRRSNNRAINATPLGQGFDNISSVCQQTKGRGKILSLPANWTSGLTHKNSRATTFRKSLRR